MKVLPTTLDGVLLLDLDAFDDARGRVVELYRRERYVELGITAELVQDTFTHSVRGTLRGLHYRFAHPQGKLVVVTHGEIFDVVVDLRRGSSTFGAWFSTLLSADNARQLWIPPGMAHGFLVTSERAEMFYKVTDPYRPDDERVVRWSDPELAIPWPAVGDLVMSDRDREAPRLRDAELPR